MKSKLLKLIPKGAPKKQVQIFWGKRFIGNIYEQLSRELKRNGWTHSNRTWGVGKPSVAGFYCAYSAQRRANSCTAKPHAPRKPRPDSPLWIQITHYLQDDYSPNTDTLATEHPDIPHPGFSRNHLLHSLCDAAQGIRS